MTYNDLRVGRVSRQGGAYHVVATTRDRSPVFSDLYSGRVVVEELMRLQREGVAETLCYVVMPDHVHWLFVLGASNLPAAVGRPEGARLSAASLCCQGDRRSAARRYDRDPSPPAAGRARYDARPAHPAPPADASCTMNLKALVAAAVGGLLITANEEPRLPGGWARQATVDADRVCSAGLDSALSEPGKRLLALECTRSVDGHVTVSQTIAADAYRGKRVRFAARIKAEKVRGWTGLMMRVVGNDQRVLGFDDMSTRPVRGNADWREAQVILDVEADASAISFGVRLTDGEGKVWIDALRFEEVSPDDPSISINLRPALPSQPQNLGLQ